MPDDKDKYAHVPNLPLPRVLTALGFTEWKPRKNGQEWSGRCPIHQPKKNTGSFSFHVDGKWNCFSCSAKGKGAIDLYMKVKQVGFREAVEETLAIPQLPVSAPVCEQVMPTENEPFKGSYKNTRSRRPGLKLVA